MSAADTFEDRDVVIAAAARAGARAIADVAAATGIAETVAGGSGLRADRGPVNPKLAP
jgi:hypothetical protein